MEQKQLGSFNLSQLKNKGTFAYSLESAIKSLCDEALQAGHAGGLQFADLFLDNCDFTLIQVDHLDGNILNNNAFNLERVTPEENQRRKNVGYYTKRGLPVPDKYSTPQNYSIYLQNKKKK